MNQAREAVHNLNLNNRVRRWSTAFKVALIYALFAALWIVFSDQIIDMIAVDKTMLSVMQTWKGLVFVMVTAVLVFLLVQHFFRRQQQLIDALRSHQKRVNLILDTIPNGIQENDLKGRITYSNPGHHKLLGYPSNALVGHYIWDFQVEQSEKNQLKDYFAYLVSHQPPPEPFICRNRTLSGEERIFDIRWAYQRNERGTLTGFISVISDITQSHEQQREIRHLAYYDPLTDLPNRFRCMETLTTMLKTARQQQEHIAVLLLDLDHFKKINDSLGHDIGDRVLQAVAARLKDSLSPDQLLGRLGGDEFIILHRQRLRHQPLPRMIDQLRSLFNEPLLIEQREMLLTASIGVAVYPNDGDSPYELLRNADSAMFHAKDSGRNSCSFFTRTMNLNVTRRFTIEEQLRAALEKGEFSMVYQPQVELQHNRIIGAEALIRWHNPLLGDISPDEFIPVAEQSNMILPIGRFVLQQALKTVARVQALRPQFRMAINLSPVQFRDFALVENLNTLLAEYDIDPGQIELEITEGVLLSGSSVVKNTLETLSGMQIKLAMDDFGTGYSSMSYLRHYPFHVLKIDRSFVNDISTTPADREMINAIVAMSQGLGLKVVAEGVETEQQREFLQTVGCDYAQGYLFNKPLTEEQLLQALESG